MKKTRNKLLIVWIGSLIFLLGIIILSVYFVQKSRDGKVSKSIPRVLPNEKDIVKNSNIKYDYNIKYLKEEKESSYIIKSGNTLIQKNVNMKYPIGTQTKMFTTVLVYKLIHDSKLSLKTKLSDIYKNNEFKNFNNNNYNNVTINSLLNQKVVFNEYLNLKSKLYTKISGDKVYSKLKKYSKSSFDINDLNTLLNKEIPKEYNIKPKENLPGVTSNTNFYILAKICEEITKEKYEDLIKKYIFEPLKMKNSSVKLPSNFKNKLDPQLTKGTYSIVSTALDMEKFIRAIKSRDVKILDANTYNHMFNQSLEVVNKGNGFESIVSKYIGNYDNININNLSLSMMGVNNDMIIILNSHKNNILPIAELITR